MSSKNLLLSPRVEGEDILRSWGGDAQSLQCLSRWNRCRMRGWGKRREARVGRFPGPYLRVNFMISGRRSFEKSQEMFCSILLISGQILIKLYFLVMRVRHVLNGLLDIVGLREGHHFGTAFHFNIFGLNQLLCGSVELRVCGGSVCRTVCVWNL